MVNIQEWLYERALEALPEQCADGSMPPGCNGPYNDEETPLRNTGHWLITWARLGSMLAEKRFLRAADMALAYLLSDQHRPSGSNWWQRSGKGMDSCNGTIGAAWTIEALCIAHDLLASGKARTLASEVFEQHPFDSKAGLWFRLESDGRILPIDGTFNHQLWFAASASRLADSNDPLVVERVSCFVKALERNFSVYPDGRIRHKIRMSPVDYLTDPGMFWYPLYKQFRKFRGRRVPTNVYLRDIGYHAFNLHAFSILHRWCPDHNFWKSPAFQSALRFAQCDEHRNNVGSFNPYGMPYNPVGFEMATALKVFTDIAPTLIDDWISRQVSELTHDGREPYGKHTADPITARARIYECFEVF